MPNAPIFQMKSVKRYLYKVIVIENGKESYNKEKGLNH